MKNSNTRGFTLIEVTIVLVVLALLAAILVPSLGGFNSLARSVRLREDLGALCSTMKMMLDDVGNSAFYQAWGTGVAGGSTVSGASFYGGGSVTTGGETTVSRTVEQGDTAGIGDWCVNCDMPRADCDENCYDNDCNETCTHPVEPIVSTTTLTYEHTAGTTSTSQGGVAYSYRSTGYGYGYGGSTGWWGWPVGLLVGDGDIPASAIGGTEWQLPVGATFNAVTNGAYSRSLNFVVGTLADQLIHQDPTLYGWSAGAGDYAGYGPVYARRYGSIGNVGARPYGSVVPHFRWRGPYIADRIIADPWGNRYMANVFALHVPAPGTYAASFGSPGYVEHFTSAVVCYSAGPNETIETRFNQPWGWYTGGDDVTVVLSGAGGIR